MSKFFSDLSRIVANWMGHWVAFVASCGVCLLWLATGPLFNFSTNWQLIINSSTTVLTFLMVFLIQHTQNLDNKALHLKLDELITAIDAPRNELAGAEKLSEPELRKLEIESEKARQASPVTNGS